MGLRDVLHRLTAPQEDLDSEELQIRATEAGGTPVAECCDRQRVTAVGTLRTVTLRPRAGVPALEAELWDGSATLRVVWLGRRRIAGIEPGRSIAVEGLVQEHDGERLIFNPRYTLRPVGA